MFTFLRQIRKSLIKSSSFRKYLVYAIGEIALVVIGILIALQVNKWNESKIRSEERKTYLHQLIGDLEADTSGFNASIKFGIDRIQSIDYVLRHLKTSKNDLNEEEMLVHINLIVWIDNIDVSSSTYEDLISTGNIDLITPQSFRRKIQNYYQAVKDAEHGKETNNLTVLDHLAPFTFDHLSWNRIFRKPYSKDVFPLPELDREVFTLWDYGYKSNEMRKFENLLTWRHIDVDIEIDRAQKLMNLAKDLLHQCQSNLRD